MSPGTAFLSTSFLLSSIAVPGLLSPARAGDGVTLSAASVRETRDVFLDEERAAEGYAWLWGISAAGCAAWSVYSPVRHGVIGAPQIAAAIGALGLAGASFKSAERHRRFTRLRSVLSAAMESSGPGGVTIEHAAALNVEEELRDLRETLSAAATGGMRTGCVVPALLCGVAVFGGSLGDDSGRDLAGVCLISALVIGGPAVINSWNINWRISRMDSLILLWRESVK